MKTKPPKRSWRTTLSGFATAIGTVLAHSPNPLASGIGQVLTAVGAIFLGHSAVDGRAL